MKILLVTCRQGDDCHALSYVQQIPTPFIGLGSVVRLKVTWQFVKHFGIADVTLRLYVNPISTVNDLSLRFDYANFMCIIFEVTYPELVKKIISESRT